MPSSPAQPNLAGTPPTLAILTPRWAAPSETFIRRHVTSLHPGGTVVLTRRMTDANWCPGVPVHSIDAVSRSPLYRFVREVGAWRLDPRTAAVRHFLERHSPSVIMAEWLNFATAWFPVVDDMGIRFFAHSHGYDVTRQSLRRVSNRWRYRRLHKMHGVITVSHLTKRRLVETLKLDPRSVHVVPCGVDVPAVIPVRPETEEIVCLHVGRMVEKKGPLITLKAFHRAQKDLLRLRLEFVGDGPLLEDCRQYCREHGISGVVTFHGPQSLDFVKQRLAAADIFLLHSITSTSGDEEGLPVAVLEAMAYGLPVISTRHAGIPEAVVDGQTGWLVDERDESAAARCLRELATQPALRRQFGEAGYHRARELFSAEHEIARLRQLLFGEPAAAGASPGDAPVTRCDSSAR